MNAQNRVFRAASPRGPLRMPGPGRLLGACYLLAAVLWLFGGLVGSAVLVYRKAEGSMPMTTLTAADLRFEGFVSYRELPWQTAPDNDPDWYLSTDNDSKIFWDGSGRPVYLEAVRLHAVHRLPAGSVVLYYLLPGQTDYSEAQKIYAAVTGEGEYTFRLGGRMISALRIDPDSTGGVPTNFTGVQLNPTAPWFMRFWPTGGWWPVLLGGPALAAALLSVLASLLGAGTEP